MLANDLARRLYGPTAAVSSIVDDESRREARVLVNGESRGPHGYGSTHAGAVADLARRLAVAS